MPNLTTNQLLNLALKTFAPNSGGPEQHLIEASLFEYCKFANSNELAE